MTLLFEQLNICLSGYDEPIRAKLKQRFQAIGAKISKQISATQVTHLLACSVLTDKYEFAVRHSIPVISEKWLELCEKLWKAGQNVVPDCKAYLLPIFSGCIICVSGLSIGLLLFRNFLQSHNLKIEEREKLSTIIPEHGGTYFKSLTTSCTHLILEKPEGEKYEAALRWNMPLVSSKWIYDSISNGYCCNYKQYPISTAASRIANTNQQSFTNVEAQKIREIFEDDLYRRANCFSFFKDCHIYLLGFNPVEKAKAMQMIYFGLGSYEPVLEKNFLLTHIVVDKPSELELLALKEQRNVIDHIISKEWIKKCFDRRSRQSESEYAYLQLTSSESSTTNDTKIKRDRVEFEQSNKNTDENNGLDIPELSFLESKPKKIRVQSVVEPPKLFDSTAFLIDSSFTPSERQALVSLIKENGGQIVENENTCKYAVFLPSTFSHPCKSINITKAWIQSCCIKHEIIPVDSNIKYKPIFLKRDARAIHSKTATFTIVIQSSTYKEDAEYIIKLLGGKVWHEVSSNVDAVLVDDETEVDLSLKMQAKRHHIPLIKTEWIRYCSNVGHFANIESFQIPFEVPSTSTHSTPPLLTLDIDTNEALQMLEQASVAPAQQVVKKVEKPLERRIFILSGFSNLEKKKELVNLIKRIKAEIFESFSSKCNYLVTDKPSKTEKFLCALIAKKWILRPEYVFKSAELQMWADESEFEWTPQLYQSMFLKNKGQKDQLFEMVSAMNAIKQEPKFIFEDWNVVLLVDHSQPYFKNLMVAGKATVAELHHHEHLTLQWLQQHQITHIFYDPLKEKSVLNPQVISALQHYCEQSNGAVKILSFDFILSYICTFSITSKEQQLSKIQQLLVSNEFRKKE